MNKFVIFLQFLVNLNDKMFAGLDNFISDLHWQPWLLSAIIDSLHMVPFLFLTFLFIELVEYFYSEKLRDISKYSKLTGPFFGALIATFPQCGFSVIASGLYTRKLITLGTLVAIFISTSDESLPVLLANPKNISMVLPIVGTKIIIAIIAGYLLDFIFKSRAENNLQTEGEQDDVGCCKHHITKSQKRDIILHPIVHTFNILVFIFLVTLTINYSMSLHLHILSSELILNGKYFQPVITSIIGLIPNCAASVLITLLYIKGAITFPAAISGLCASSGLGLLVLVKHNDSVKDTARIVFLILFISIFSGLLLQIIK